MKSALFSLILFSLFISLNSELVAQSMNFKYPITKKDPSVSDDYFGTTVADPYRWLEDDNSEETKAWVKAQNEITFGYLKTIPYRKQIKDRLEKIWNYEKYGTPFKKGGKYYYYKNTGLQNQAILYVQETLNSSPVVVLDPNTLSKEGTVALGAIAFNKEGDKIAYQLSKAGSDWQTIYIKDLETGQTLSDEIHWVKFSGIEWFNDGFFYSRYPEPKKGEELKGTLLNHKVYYHKLGTPQKEDELIYEEKDNPKRNIYTNVTEDERFVALNISEGTSGNMLLIKDLQKANSGFIKIVDNFEKDWSMVDNDGEWIFVKTNYKAPKSRIIAINLSQPDEKNWKEIVPEDKNAVLQGAGFIGEKLVTTWLHNASSKVKFYDMNGKFLNELVLPGIGTLGGITGKRDDNQAFYAFSSYTRPNSVYELNTTTMQSTIFKAPKVDFTSDDYVTKQVWYTSKDGTKVPMFISHKKGLKLNGKNPTLLYGYGGFNISQQPQFAVTRALLMEMGGIFAVANIRGGGEFGEEWHKSGTKERKQNVFDDFIAAAEFLIRLKYTSKDFLAIQGGSNGGLLVGACMAQRPDLFKVAFPAVGVLDMLRYHKFTIGRAWSVDYGLSEIEKEFKYLYKYSPLHNLKKMPYPATMITTGDHDDRVVPAHSFKFAAALQEHHTGTSPVLIRIETSGGHGAGKPTSKLIEESADNIAFMFYNMGVKVVK